jgi:hypothetical protein
VRLAFAALLALALAAPAQAQFLARRPAPAGPPPGTPPVFAETWPFPPPDPQSWWDEKRPKPAEAADPLGGRHVPHGRRLPVVDNGADPATYRLWGLTPLQWQVLQDDEMILEVWVRPARNVRQTIVRVVVRDDGHAFVQGRAGLACCEAGIGRRIGFDDELPAGAAQQFKAFRDDPMWATPRDVQAVKGAGSTETICVEGVGYDLTLVTAAGARSLHRACDDVAVGQVAPVLEAVLRAALGHDPRFDVLYHGRIDFGPERAAWEAFASGGGTLKPDPRARHARPGLEPEPEPAADAPAEP